MNSDLATATFYLKPSICFVPILLNNNNNNNYISSTQPPFYLSLSLSLSLVWIFIVDNPRPDCCPTTHTFYYDI